jgi:hypothetical protein
MTERKRHPDFEQAYEDEDLTRMFWEHPQYVSVRDISRELHVYHKDLPKRLAAFGVVLNIEPRRGLTQWQIDQCVAAVRAFRGGRLLRAADESRKLSRVR